MPVHFIKEDFVEEVPEGKLITLHCHSNDQDHNFLFWLLGKDIVIGPGNAYNYSVYEYEVLTGDLVIKVSLHEYQRGQQYFIIKTTKSCL